MREERVSFAKADNQVFTMFARFFFPSVDISPFQQHFADVAQQPFKKHKKTQGVHPLSFFFAEKETPLELLMFGSLGAFPQKAQKPHKLVNQDWKLLVSPPKTFQSSGRGLILLSWAEPRKLIMGSQIIVSMRNPPPFRGFGMKPP